MKTLSLVALVLAACCQASAGEFVLRTAIVEDRPSIGAPFTVVVYVTNGGSEPASFPAALPQRLAVWREGYPERLHPALVLRPDGSDGGSALPPLSIAPGDTAAWFFPVGLAWSVDMKRPVWLFPSPGRWRIGFPDLQGLSLDVDLAEAPVPGEDQRRCLLPLFAGGPPVEALPQPPPAEGLRAWLVGAAILGASKSATPEETAAAMEDPSTPLAIRDRLAQHLAGRWTGLDEELRARCRRSWTSQPLRNPLPKGSPLTDQAPGSLAVPTGPGMAWLDPDLPLRGQVTAGPEVDVALVKACTPYFTALFASDAAAFQAAITADYALDDMPAKQFLARMVETGERKQVGDYQVTINAVAGTAQAVATLRGRSRHRLFDRRSRGVRTEEMGFELVLRREGEDHRVQAHRTQSVDRNRGRFLMAISRYLAGVETPPCPVTGIHGTRLDLPAAVAEILQAHEIPGRESLALTLTTPGTLVPGRAWALCQVTGQIDAYLMVEATADEAGVTLSRHGILNAQEAGFR